MSMPIPTAPSKRPTPSPNVPPTGVPAALPGTPAPTTEPKAGTSHPTLKIPTVTTHPTPILVTTESPIPATAPSFPTVSFPPLPNAEPTQVPVAITSSTPSTFDPLQPTVTTEESAFTCIDGGVVSATQPFQAEKVDITVGYELEASLPLESFQEYMEQLILWSILTGALECGRIDVEGSVPMTTTLTDDRCQSEVDRLNNCVVAQTSASVLLVGELVDPPIASFLAYVKVQSDMETFHEVLFGVDRVTYRTPTLFNTPPGIEAPEEPGEPAPLQSDNTRLSVTPWTIGSALVMCKYHSSYSYACSFVLANVWIVSIGVAGMVSLGAWARNRRIRNERHLNHLEGASELSPDTTQP